MSSKKKCIIVLRNKLMSAMAPTYQVWNLGSVHSRFLKKGGEGGKRGRSAPIDVHLLCIGVHTHPSISPWLPLELPRFSLAFSLFLPYDSCRDCTYNSLYIVTTHCLKTFENDRIRIVLEQLMEKEVKFWTPKTMTISISLNVSFSVYNKSE